MIQSIVLDGLVILIVLMIASIGYNRGGMRELCASAGLLFGSRLADAWAPRWGTWLAGKVDISEGASTFIVYVAVLAVSTLVCGYGASLAFFSRPGPGGRLYGAALGLINGVALTAFILDGVRRYLLDGDLPKIVADSHVALAMVDGFGWVLLGIAAFVVIATLFGFLIRENEPEESLLPSVSARSMAPSPSSSTERAPSQARPAVAAPTRNTPAEAAADTAQVQETAPLRVREVRHWEEPVEPNPRTAFGAGWSQTWPVSSPGAEVKTPWELEEERRRLRQAPASGRPADERSGSRPSSPESAPRSESDVLRDWLAEERKNDPDGRRGA
ncbi:MAG: CvpA family protein [Thermomicrobiales bacterium]